MNKFIAVLIFTVLPLQAFAEDAKSNPINKEHDTLVKTSPFSLNFGFGIPYGVLGLNLNYRINSLFEVHAGVGTWGPVYGAKLRPIPQNRGFNIGLFHSTNTITDTCHNESCDIIKESYKGVNMSLGYTPPTGNGWEFALVFALSQGDFDDDIKEAKDRGYDVETDGSMPKISFGYRWAL